MMLPILLDTVDDDGIDVSGDTLLFVLIVILVILLIVFLAQRIR